MALLQKAKSVASTTKSWRAEAVETSQLAGPGMNLQEEIRIKIAVQAPLKLKRENSGADQTVLVCDGVDSFYSGDGHSYYRSSAKVTPECDYPLSSFYKLDVDPVSASVIGRDHVALADGDHTCDVIRAEWKHAAARVIRTMCIEGASGLILRDANDSVNNAGARMVVTTTFTSYEKDPKFAPDAFQFSIPPGAVEAKPPI